MSPRDSADFYNCVDSSPYLPAVVYECRHLLSIKLEIREDGSKQMYQWYYNGNDGEIGNIRFCFDIPPETYGSFHKIVTSMLRCI